MGTAEWREATSPAYYKRGDYVPGLKTVSYMAELAARLNVGRGSSGIYTSSSELDSSAVNSDIPLLTYGQEMIQFLRTSMDEWKKKQNDRLQVVRHQGDKGGDELDDPDLPKMDEGRQPLSRKLPIPSSKINPYRMIILLRMGILGLFFHYRIRHPVNDSYGLCTLILIHFLCV